MCASDDSVDADAAHFSGDDGGEGPAARAVAVAMTTRGGEEACRRLYSTQRQQPPQQPQQAPRRSDLSADAKRDRAVVWDPAPPPTWRGAYGRRGRHAL
eukprot:gene8668-3384_t